MIYLHLPTGNLTKKEMIKNCNSDYKSSGEYWYYYGPWVDWIKSIDNEFARQKIVWIDEDIKNGFGGYYSDTVYFQKHVKGKWLGEENLKKLSIFWSVQGDWIEFFERDKQSRLFQPIPREQYHNIYNPYRFGFDEYETYNCWYYDMRVDKLAKDVSDDIFDFYRELRDFSYDLQMEEEKSWRQIDVPNYDYAPYHIPESFFEETKKKKLDFESWTDPNTMYNEKFFLKIGCMFLKDFEFQQALGSKTTHVFTRPINEKYQWALIIHGGTWNWNTSSPHIVVVSTSVTKTIKPKDVLYQELSSRVDFGYPDGRAVQIKKYSYINYYFKRYIDWMQPKILDVIDRF